MGRRDTILAHFSSEDVADLLEFSKYLSGVNADVFIFMARKSLRLYEMLLYVGCPRVEAQVLSDRVLETSLERLRGKRVVLVDDTLISGTSLARAKEKLQAAGAIVSVCVFCADDRWWSRELVKPDHVQAVVKDSRLRSFCAAEVRALAAVPLPYIVDFPLTKGVRLTRRMIELVGSSLGWTATRTSWIQETQDVAAYAFLPDEGTMGALEIAIGSHLVSLLEIVKIRVFLRFVGDHAWATVVPIATLSALSVDEVDDLFEHLVDTAAASRLSSIADSLESSTSKLRFIQYAISVALGGLFALHVRSLDEHMPAFEFDSVEAGRHFGPWNQSEFDALHKSSVAACLRRHRHDPVIGDYEAAPPVADAVQVKALSEIPNRSDRVRVPELLDDLISVFRRLHLDQEVPAREEVLRLGPKILTATEAEAPHKFRLDRGIPWRTLIGRIRHQYDSALRTSDPALAWHQAQVVSLVLDVLNDLGIAVPITSYDAEGGLLVRAYRHGEDVLFGDAEVDLAFKTIQGVTEAWERETLPKLHTEKVLVALLRVGWAKGFLRPVRFDEEIGPGVASVNYNLKGAVATLFPDRIEQPVVSNEQGLTDYLVGRGVLEAVDGGYRLGVPVEANHDRGDHPTDAYEVGEILGSLFAKGPDWPGLSEGDLTLLMTCASPRNAAGAVAMELRLAEHLLRSVRKAKSISWNDAKALVASQAPIKGALAESLYSGAWKAANYFSGEVPRIAKRCEKQLLGGKAHSTVAARWRGYWEVLEETQTKQAEVFDPLTKQLTTACWTSRVFLYLMRIALRDAELRIAGHDPNRVRSLDAWHLRLSEFNELVQNAGLSLPKGAKDVVERLDQLHEERWPVFDTRTAYAHGLEGLRRTISEVSYDAELTYMNARAWGRTEGRHDYNELLYFDLRDSMSVVERESGDIARHRESRRKLLRSATKQLRTVTYLAAKDRCEIYCWDGMLESTNDQKHIYASGNFRHRHLGRALHNLLALAKSQQRQIRLLMVPCDLGVGLGASKFREEPEVKGDLFLETLSRIKSAVKDWADKSLPGQSVLVMMQGSWADEVSAAHPEWQPEAWTCQVENATGHYDFQLLRGPIQ